MSGKTARRARRERPYLLESDNVFAATLSAMMQEYGIDFDRCTKEQVNATLAMCCAEADLCWDELVLWVLHGDDEKAKTLEVAAAGRRLGR